MFLKVKMLDTNCNNELVKIIEKQTNFLSLKMDRPP